MIARSFYFIRHGQTDWNAADKVQGSSDIPLNKTGQQQAVHATRALSKQPIDLIVTSDLVRAFESAELINKVLKVGLVEEPRIREKDFGVLEGKTLIEADAIQALTDLDTRQPMQRNGKRQVQDSEHYDDFEARVLAGVEAHLKANPKANVLFISHGAVFKVLHTVLFGEKLGCENAVPYFFEKTAEGWKLHDLSEDR